MKRLVMTGAMVLLAWYAGGGPAVAGETSVVGTWKLLVFEGHSPDGEVSEPFGPSPLGSLTYTASHRMSVHLLQPGRPAFEAGTFREGTDEEVRAAFEGYFGYYGTYSLDVEEEAGIVTGSVTHHVEGCALPNYIGTDRTRSFELKGGRLTLTTPRETGGEPAVWYRVVWERFPARGR